MAEPVTGPDAVPGSGAPWENGFAEAFHSRLRDEFLNVEAFATVREAKVLGGVWRSDYNERRPHGALGYRTPGEFGRVRLRRIASGSGSRSREQHTPSEERRTSTLITSGT